MKDKAGLFFQKFKNKNAESVFNLLKNNRLFFFLSEINRFIIILFSLYGIFTQFKISEISSSILILYVWYAAIIFFIYLIKPIDSLNKWCLLIDLIVVNYFIHMHQTLENPLVYLVVTTISTGSLSYGLYFGIISGLLAFIADVGLSGIATHSVFHGFVFIVIGVVSGYIGELFNYIKNDWTKDMEIVSSNFKIMSDKYKVMLGLYAISQEIEKINVSSKDILNALLITLREIPGADNGILRILTSENKLKAIAHYGHASHKVAELVLELDTGLSGIVANTQKPLLFTNVKNNNEIIQDLIKRHSHQIDEDTVKELKSIKSMMSVPLRVDKHLIGTIFIYNTQQFGAFGQDHLKILSIMASQFALHTLNVRLLEKERNSNLKALQLAVEALDLRDNYTFRHSQEVSMWCAKICNELELKSDFKDAVISAAQLHDVGKIGVADSILNKKGSLSPEEFEVIKLHPVWGSQLLQNHDALATLALMVRHHHERFDGKGYPDGLAGEQIPLGARIISIAAALML